jgi:hypothetical protein
MAVEHGYVSAADLGSVGLTPDPERDGQSGCYVVFRRDPSEKEGRARSICATGSPALADWPLGRLRHAEILRPSGRTPLDPAGRGDPPARLRR